MGAGGVKERTGPWPSASLRCGGTTAHRDGFSPAPRLPAAFLVDAQGRVVERFAGRISPEAWDRIAELMP